ncbi:hypothetical protein AN639_06390 [Candidatus Epulonipiscium fishelsonii]|uniref:Uncharacterized protein n=1 Tax=Candidatus Epulonipiscium fishelsonii TaxID=77094 RepID=A0ACC8XAR0_9FIRM|nr:hypothetical protein AN639_06390 [Epulopiscium sp. SCG-B05WGA-EpuloA1]ONI39462.1 hypothetical protein AN396_08645 [Epulopiscium sp. SCG-B11WGA-EpuloA1]
MNKKKKATIIVSSILAISLVGCIVEAQFGEMISKSIQDNNAKIVQNTLDVNGDGELSAEEITNAPFVLLELDKNNDGELDPEESHNGPFDVYTVVRQNRIFNYIDDDGDTIISKEEIENSSNILRYFDMNKDAKLTDDEFESSMMTAPPEGVDINIDMDAMRDMMEDSKTQTDRNFDKATGSIVPADSTEQYNGYTLIYGAYDSNRIQVQSSAYLMDTDGNFVHEWTTDDYVPQGATAYLTEDGLLYRTVSQYNWRELENFAAGGTGKIEIVDWDSNVLWSFEYGEFGEYLLHHDFTVLPNGNIIAIAYDLITPEDANVQYGIDIVDPIMNSYHLSERLIEIKPNLEDGTADIVWEWNALDRVVQNIHSDLDNYGDITDKSKINAYYYSNNIFYTGQFFHLNSIDYNAEFDQLIVSSGMYNELWVIDHNTTTDEAKGEAGDLLYRWGNEQTYSEDGTGEQTLYFQHDAYWIDAKNGEIQVFNNGANRQLEDGESNYTEILRMKLPVSPDGEWDINAEPEITWHFNKNGDDSDFFSLFMGGARMLPNGNTIAVSAADYRIVEINPDGEIILDYIMPIPGRGMRVDKISPDYSGLQFDTK